jgi:hypothetical protein
MVQMEIGALEVVPTGRAIAYVLVCDTVSTAFRLTTLLLPAAWRLCVDYEPLILGDGN